MQAAAQEVSKGFLAKTLDMEEMWFAAVGGKLKMWSAQSHPDLKVRDDEPMLWGMLLLWDQGAPPALQQKPSAVASEINSSGCYLRQEVLQIRDGLA
jgi:hypothetical protein